MAVESNQITIKERIARVAERNTHQAATRYLRIRSLIEEAGSFIGEADIPKHSANKFGAKLLKARRLLDRGNENEVGLLVEEIIEELRNDIRENENGIILLKKNIKERFSEVCNPQRPSRQEYRPFSSPRDIKKSKKYVHVAGSPSPPRSSPKNTTALLHQARKGLKKLEKGSNSSVGRRPSTHRRKSSGQASTTDNDVEEEEELNTLNTLQLAIHILQELPKASLTDHEFSETEEALKLTKPLLMTHEGCQKLRPFLETLKTSLALSPHRRQPELNMALQGIRIVTYEVSSQPRKKTLHGILKH